MITRMSLALVAALALLFGLAAQCSTPVEDRSGPNGAQPDGYQDATHVTVYRNADQVPNIATFCIGAYGFASTLKDTSSGGSGSAAPSLVRFPELDKTCGS